MGHVDLIVGDAIVSKSGAALDVAQPLFVDFPSICVETPFICTYMYPFIGGVQRLVARIKSPELFFEFQRSALVSTFSASSSPPISSLSTASCLGVPLRSE